MHPLLGPLDAIERGACSRSAPELRPFFRDVNDHLKLVDEEIVAPRDLLAVVLQANMAVISGRAVQYRPQDLRLGRDHHGADNIVNVPLRNIAEDFGEPLSAAVLCVSAFVLALARDAARGLAW